MPSRGTHRSEATPPTATSSSSASRAGDVRRASISDLQQSRAATDQLRRPGRFSIYTYPPPERRCPARGGGQSQSPIRPGLHHAAPSWTVLGTIRSYDVTQRHLTVTTVRVPASGTGKPARPAVTCRPVTARRQRVPGGDRPARRSLIPTLPDPHKQ